MNGGNFEDGNFVKTKKCSHDLGPFFKQGAGRSNERGMRSANRVDGSSRWTERGKKDERGFSGRPKDLKRFEEKDNQRNE